MLRYLLVLALGLTGVHAPADAPANLERLTGWNRLALNAVRLTSASDATSARLYAMVNVAAYDAVNGINRAHAPALVRDPGPKHADPEAAALAAAHAVLAGLDAARKAEYDARLAADLASLRPGHRRDAGVAWGARVGSLVLAARSGDGSSPVESQPGGTGPGVFPQPWSGVQYRNLRPFAVANPAAHAPGPPPTLDSLDYAAAFAEVALLGNANIPAPDKLATFQFWAVPAGTVQPPGEWLKIALTVAAARRAGLAEGARLLALLTMALSDTTIVTVGAKFQHRHWRPATAITQADTDGNPYTASDPAWLPRAGSAGSTPEWVSGHSSYSATGAAILAGFFCTDAIPFDHVTDSAPGGAGRSYPGFSAAAAEAGRSRVFGGQHFEFSNQAGLALGRGVAVEVMRTALLPHRC